MDRWRGFVVVALVVMPACGGVPQVDGPTSEALRAAFSAEQAKVHLEALQQIADENGGTRAIGSSGYDASVDYVAEQLSAAGFEVVRQQFGMPLFAERAPTEIAVDDGPRFSGGDHARAMIYSVSGEVTASLDEVARADDGQPRGSGGCEESDWRGFRRGRIALLAPGPCPRRDQVEHAQEAGATAVIVVYPQWNRNEVRRPTLIRPEGIEIAVVGVSAEVGEALDDALRGDREVSLTVATEIRDGDAVNVIVERAGNEGGVVMLGAHLDSVLEGPGINDNGSGVAALIELAAAVAEQPAGRRTVRFGLWAGEELGVHGAQAYVDSLSASEIADLDAYLNADMLASPNAARLVYDEQAAAHGSERITQLLLDHLDASGVPGDVVDLRGGSDHGPFQRAGVPTGGVFSGAADPMTSEQADLFDGAAGEPMDRCYHLACDRLDGINLGSLETLAEALAHAVAELASGRVDPRSGG